MTLVYGLSWDVEWSQLRPDLPRDNVVGIVTDCPLNQDWCLLFILEVKIRHERGMLILTPSVSSRRRFFVVSD